MPEPLKNLYTIELLESLSGEVKGIYSDFDTTGFMLHVMNDDWEAKEFKSRMMYISESLHLFLPVKYAESVQILMKVASKFNGFQYMFFPCFVELYGLDDYETSMKALEVFTQYSSSEFAVRPFIKKYNHQMIVQMVLWAESENNHVRRLASEGCRPRLPWAMALSEFKKDPRPIMSILEKLKNDESEYVRRSVSNNLNDISKDNPQMIISIARNWLGQNKQTDRIIKHACRTLLKQGHLEMMQLFGFIKPNYVKIRDFAVQGIVIIGEKLKFSFILETQKSELGKLRIEYAIDFMKKNRILSRKVFKISESDVKSQRKKVCKLYSFKKISTRKYYVGHHKLSVIVNGQEMASRDFILN